MFVKVGSVKFFDEGRIYSNAEARRFGIVLL